MKPESAAYLTKADTEAWWSFAVSPRGPFLQVDV